MQIALVNSYARVGIFPATVVGHSSGEITAAYASGGLTMREAIIISYFRGLAVKNQTLNGGMAAVGLSKDEVSPFLCQGLTIACENSPSSVTISGDLDKLAVAMEAIQKQHPQAFLRKLQVDMAYHSGGYTSGIMR